VGLIDGIVVGLRTTVGWIGPLALVSNLPWILGRWPRLEWRRAVGPFTQPEQRRALRRYIAAFEKSAE
jgi:hypothetical protein